jgi:hypothetical protein
MPGQLWSGHADCMMHDYKLSGLPSCMMHDHICMVWSFRLYGQCWMSLYWPCLAKLSFFHTDNATKPQATIAWKPMDELLCYVYTVGRKKSARMKKLLPGGFLMNFSPIFCIKLLLYLSATVRKIKSLFLIPNIHCNFFARCKIYELYFC